MVSYDEIRNYIIEKHGKRVSNKWIAQIKRQVGMLQFFREDGDTEVVTCPKEAEGYILEAFEHFGILQDRNDLSNLSFDDPISVETAKLRDEALKINEQATVEFTDKFVIGEGRAEDGKTFEEIINEEK